MMNKIQLAGDMWIMKSCTDNREYNAVISGSDFGNLILLLRKTALSRLMKFR